jgi:hypothetical protein
MIGDVVWEAWSGGVDCKVMMDLGRLMDTRGRGESRGSGFR